MQQPGEKPGNGAHDDEHQNGHAEKLQYLCGGEGRFNIYDGVENGADNENVQYDLTGVFIGLRSRYSYFGTKIADEHEQNQHGHLHCNRRNIQGNDPAFDKS